MDKALIVRTETGRIIGKPQDIGIDKGVLKRTQEIMPKIDKLNFTEWESRSLPAIYPTEY